MAYTLTRPATDSLRDIDAVVHDVPEHVAEWMRAHSDEAKYGRTVARRRARQRAALPKPRKAPRLTPAQAEKAMRENWGRYGRGAYPGTPAEQMEAAA